MQEPLSTIYYRYGNMHSAGNDDTRNASTLASVGIVMAIILPLGAKNKKSAERSFYVCSLGG